MLLSNSKLTGIQVEMEVSHPTAIVAPKARESRESQAALVDLSSLQGKHQLTLVPSEQLTCPTFIKGCILKMSEDDKQKVWEALLEDEEGRQQELLSSIGPAVEPSDQFSTSTLTDQMSPLHTHETVAPIEADEESDYEPPRASRPKKKTQKSQKTKPHCKHYIQEIIYFLDQNVQKDAAKLWSVAELESEVIKPMNAIHYEHLQLDSELKPTLPASPSEFQAYKLTDKLTTRKYASIVCTHKQCRFEVKFRTHKNATTGEPSLRFFSNPRKFHNLPLH